ncbi:hypothetical protein VTL71DRAFT_4875 [Oculimacula yallundae]|uniref:Zn(2)-C6 fungal-type domain-containing protein n=1 Tax=Oculimacula yallundae TaxID=86028 RepID=A0ABR4C4X0_9HELO
MTLRGFLVYFTLLTCHISSVYADGIGLIGWGKTLYNPTCAFACRYSVRSQSLACTPTESSQTFGTAHHSVKTPPSCYVNDVVFMKTIALCIDTYCPLAGNPPLSLLESYWAGHLATGTLGTSKYVPSLSYQDALAAARADEMQAANGSNSTTSNATTQDHAHTKIKVRQHDSHGTAVSPKMKSFDVSSTLLTTTGGKGMLNVTSFVDPETWQMGYNYMLDFEINETGHSTMTIVITIVAIFLPVALSLLRFIPGLAQSQIWNELQKRIVYPALWGAGHRTPIVGAIIPTRGQALYIALISFLNVILLLAPYVYHRPQASFSTLGLQTLSIVGNRAGSMAMGNIVVLFLFAARNNPLIYITNWSYGTYLLLHRWLGYWAIIQTIIHSFMLMANYMVLDMYKAEFARDYWAWGIVATVCVCAIWPFSHLWVRQKFYEFFLLTHIIFSLLFLVGYYYHIWYLYTYNWGYEIWMFVAGGIWGIDRVIRVVRMVSQGSRTAIVTTIKDVEGEYLRFDVEGKEIHGGVVYLCFPTLGWRFWETHPFSVASCADSVSSEKSTNDKALIPTNEELFQDQKQSAINGSTTVVIALDPSSTSENENDKLAATTFITRVRTGVTKQLSARITKDGGSARIRVLIDGPYYHSGNVSAQLAPCSSMICIAGGVGITATLPYLKKFSVNKPTKLFWSARKRGLITELEPVLAALSSNLQVETSIGERLDLDTVLGTELASRADGTGLLGIVVCGPPGMADDHSNLLSSQIRAERNPTFANPRILDQSLTGSRLLLLLSTTFSTVVSDRSRQVSEVWAVPPPPMPPKKSKARLVRAKQATTVPPSPRPRTHAFTGCLTCRERHVKCDLKEPACHNCTRLKVPCEGYSRKYTWLSPKMPESGRHVADPPLSEEVDEGQSSRRVLFSDEERVAMAVRMSHECCTNTSFLDLDRVLRELQDQVTDATEFLRIGPFAIFPATPLPVPTPEPEPLQQTDMEVVEDVEIVEQDGSVSGSDLNLSLSHFAWSELEDTHAWDALDTAFLPFSGFNSGKGSINGNSCGIWDPITSNQTQSYPHEAITMEVTGQYTPDMLSLSGQFDLSIDPSLEQDSQICSLEFLADVPSILQMPNTANMSKIPSEARLLLDYYSSRMIELMSMSPIKKPPWKTIHLPCAMSALAELLVHGEARSFAKMALFYALLSISAFHIGCGNKESELNAQHWKSIGARHKATAQKYLQSSLDNSLPKATRGKYKEVLMSMLSMVTIGVFSGDMQDSQNYLAESESLIRTFGLPKPVKSLKISKLHHIFSYLRIIHESTSLRGGKSKTDSQHDPCESTEVRLALNQELSSNMAQSASSRLAYIEDEGDPDMEEDPLFVSMYQLPTTLLSLISQTSSLSKQLESPESSTPEFIRRCKIIEDRIFRWKAPENLSLTTHFRADLSNSPEAAAKEIAAHLVTATYQALIVHFQVQIRNTNPRVLQHYVISAADHLLAQEQLKQSLKICHTPFPWPGFIVGCEACDVSARQKIDLYLKTVRCYNVGSVMESEKVVYEVWRRQDMGRVDHRWEDVLKDWGMQIVLT